MLHRNLTTVANKLTSQPLIWWHMALTSTTKMVPHGSINIQMTRVHTLLYNYLGCAVMQQIKNAKATAMTTVHAANAVSTCKFGQRPRLLLLAFLGLGELTQSSARGVQLSGHGTSSGQLLTGSSSSSSGQSSSFPWVKVVRRVRVLTMVGEAGWRQGEWWW